MSITDPTLAEYADQMAALAADLESTIRGLHQLVANGELALETALDGAELAVNACLHVTHRDAAARLFDSEIYFWRRQRDKAARRMQTLSGNPAHGAKAEMNRAQFRFGQACENIAELEAAKAEMLAEYDDPGEVA